MLSLSGYEVRQVVSSGPRWSVFRGLRSVGAQPVLIKVARPEHASARDTRRLRREFDRGRALEAPGVPKYLSVEHHEHGLALVLDDYGAGPLASQIPQGGADLEFCHAVARTAAEGLSAIHRHGLVHDEISPSGILVHPSTLETRLLDLGAACARHEVDLVDAAVEGRLHYVAPERTGRLDRPVDERSDLYSLGVTLYQMLTGQLPFPGDDVPGVVHAQIARQPRDPRALRPDAPKPLCAVVLKLLAKDPDDRYGSARGLVADLLACQRFYDSGETARVFSIGQQDSTEAFRISTRLYGREREVKALAAAWKRCAAGAFELVFVRGASGLGKTSLVGQIEPLVLAGGAHYGAGKFDELHRGKPYSALLAALTRALNALLAEPDERLSTWKARVEAALGPNAALVTALLPVLELVIGKQAPPPDVPPEESQARFQYAFLAFLSALPGPGQPLALFIDDLQWADEASLALLARLHLAAPRNLLVIAAYRTDDAGSAAVEALLHARTQPSREIALEALAADDVALLLADTLAQPIAGVRSLAAVCIEKTDGNPFSLMQFLGEAHNFGMFDFDVRLGSWSWDEAGIRKLDVTANVAELLIRRIRRLEPDVQRLLTVAACVGNPIDVATLATVLKLPFDSTLDRATRASEERLLVPTLEPGPPDPEHAAPGVERTTQFRFVHDRVRAAAYSLVQPAERADLHASIADLLLDAFREHGRSDRLFELVYHLRESSEAGAPHERSMRCETYLAAGRKAKAAAAWEQASQLLEWAAALIQDEDWSARYDLALQVYQELAEVAYLSHDFERMDAVIDVILRRATQVLDQAHAYEIRFLAYTARNRLVDAVRSAVHVLGLLGIRLPEKPSRAHVLWGLAATRLRLRGGRSREVPMLREMTDRRALAAMRILRSVATPAYLTMPDMLPLLMFEMIRLTLRHGACVDSAEGFNGYGVILMAAFDDLEGAHEMGELTTELARRFDGQARTGAAHRNYNLFFRHWQHAARSALQPLLDAHRISLESGDIESAIVSAVTHCWYALFCGQPLEEVEQACTRFTEVVRMHRQERFLADMEFLATVCKALRRQHAGHDLPLRELLREQDMLDRRVRNGDTSGVASFAYTTAFLHFLFGNPERALELCRLCDKHMQGLAATMYPPMFHLLYALVRVAAIDHVTGVDAAAELSGARASHARLARWAAHAPANLAHKLALVEAELARVESADARAMELYDRAIELAGRNGFVHEQAMAAELAGRFYVSRGRNRIALQYLKEARHAYLEWGASSKVAALDAQYPELIPNEPRNRDDDLDARAVIRASQAISGEIFQDQLLHKLMTIVMENAGAERVVLILRSSGGAEIVAKADVSNGARIGVRQALAESGDCASSIVNWVLRTKESVVLRDAAGEGAFRGDAYVSSSRATSVLCVPIIIKGNVGGALYLENNLVRGAFTPTRIGVLSVLAAQAGISIENANLIQRLEHEAVSRNNLLRFFPTGMVGRIMEDKSSLEAIETEVTAVFSDISGFTALSAQLPPRELVDLLNEYFPAMADVVFRHQGVLEKYIGDALLAVWGAPFRDPLDADRALGAAVDMQRAVRRLNERWAGKQTLRIHVGLNTGPVAAGNVGSERYVQYATIGDATNVASRICEVAAPGEVLISEVTLSRLQHNPWTMEALAPVVLRGKPNPIRLHRVRWD